MQASLGKFHLLLIFELKTCAENTHLKVIPINWWYLIKVEETDVACANVVKFDFH